MFPHLFPHFSQSGETSEPDIPEFTLIRLSAHQSSNLKNPCIYGGCSANQPFSALFPHPSISFFVIRLGSSRNLRFPCVESGFGNFGNLYGETFGRFLLILDGSWSIVSCSNGKGIIAKGVFFLLFSEGGTEVGYLLL